MERDFSYLVALVLRDNFHPAKRKSFNQSKPKVRFIDNTFAYMIFVIFAPHRQDFWVDCCSTQYCVNRAKINNASKQRKEWQYGLLCQNSINRDDTDNVEHNCLLCGPILLHMTGKKVHVEQNCFSGWANFSSTKHAQLFMCSKLAPHKNNCSMDNVCGVRDKYHVCTVGSYKCYDLINRLVIMLVYNIHVVGTLSVFFVHNFYNHRSILSVSDSW